MKRQADNADNHDLCKDRPANEYFRLQSDEDCRDVVRCSDQGLLALVEKPTTDPVPANWKNGGYLEKMPKDPWGHDYLYLNPGIKREIDVMSYGADGQQGGEGFDADLGSWML